MVKCAPFKLLSYFHIARIINNFQNISQLTPKQRDPVRREDLVSFCWLCTLNTPALPMNLKLYVDFYRRLEHPGNFHIGQFPFFLWLTNFKLVDLVNLHVAAVMHLKWVILNLLFISKKKTWETLKKMIITLWKIWFKEGSICFMCK